MAQNTSNEFAPLSGETVQDSSFNGTYQAPATFSIATPTVTTILPLTDNLNDTSFMLPTGSYQQETIANESFSSSQLLPAAQTISSPSKVPPEHGIHDTLAGQQVVANQSHDDKKDLSAVVESRLVPESLALEEGSKSVAKKRGKVTKKGAKLDAKSKLEKSRQSARECRARKKLRYQYLEDLVCNREKAVVKLREELSTFCELSKQIDIGSINESDRRLLIDQTKENSRSESTSLL